jgi:hypothetical protein
LRTNKRDMRPEPPLGVDSAQRWEAPVHAVVPTDGGWRHGQVHVGQTHSPIHWRRSCTLAHRRMANTAVVNVSHSGVSVVASPSPSWKNASQASAASGHWAPVVRLGTPPPAPWQTDGVLADLAAALEVQGLPGSTALSRICFRYSSSPPPTEMCAPR